ncbi:hypothetical protein ANCDUO_18752, partial [Ancylostoma duodenale]
YGTRIRAPHAFVMVFLFGSEPLLQKILTILRLTKTHAMNLAKFSFCFRLLKELIMRIDGTKDYPREWQSFVAAAIVGYFVFGDSNSVNMQYRPPRAIRSLDPAIRRFFPADHQ